MSNQTIEISTSRSPRQNGGFIKIPATRVKVSSREDIEPALETLREFLEEELQPEPKFERGDVVQQGEVNPTFILLDVKEARLGINSRAFTEADAIGFTDGNFWIRSDGAFFHDSYNVIDHIDI